MAELESRQDLRAVIVTGTPPAFCVGGDSQALAGHADSGSYDKGLPPEPAQPGGGARLDADFAWQMGYRLPIIAAVNGVSTRCHSQAARASSTSRRTLSLSAISSGGSTLTTTWRCFR